MSPHLSLWLADAVLVLHVAVVGFVIGGLLVVPVGQWAGWPWVRSLAFRLTHLGAIGVVVVQAWLGQSCPLTTLESWLRARAGAAGYTSGFLAHWLQRLIFYDAPAWVFTLAYSLFAALVVGAWWRWPPVGRGRG